MSLNLLCFGWAFVFIKLRIMSVRVVHRRGALILFEEPYLAGVIPIPSCFSRIEIISTPSQFFFELKSLSIKIPPLGGDITSL